MFSSGTCYAYPSVAANTRQDLGMILNYSISGTCKPSLGYAIADDIVSPPPGWFLGWIRSSGACPLDQKWGDYNTVREFEPGERSWIGAGHYIQGATNCIDCSTPLYFVFGRERDKESYTRWQDSGTSVTSLPVFATA